MIARCRVYRASLDVSDDTQAKLESWLADDELARASRSCDARRRRHFLTSRGLLRGILAAELSVSPRDLEFSTTPSGKPLLACENRPRARHFSFSHSGCLAVVATADVPVGIDVEVIREIPRAASIARFVFTESEQRALARVPNAQRSVTFLRGWTRKEAAAKACGDGLSAQLGRIEIGFKATTGSPIRMQCQEDLASWLIHDLIVDPRYVAALAIASRAELHQDDLLSIACEIWAPPLSAAPYNRQP